MFSPDEYTYAVAGCASFSFNFSNLSAAGKKIVFSKTAPSWREATGGLNLEGYCKKDKNCEAYNKSRVVIPWGYKNFDWVNDESKCKCPLCGKYVTPETCGFSNCKWKYKGVVKEAGKDPVKKSVDWQNVDPGIYHTFEDMEQLSWNSLLIEVKWR